MHLILPWEFFLVIKETIALTKNLIFHGKNKHIDIKFHYLHDLVKDKEIILEFCSFENQVANIFTKSIKVETLLNLKKMMGIKKLEEICLKKAM